jgi:dTDP-4-dehydrorhamnose reductase
MENKLTKKILVLGANGMLGNAVMRYFAGINTVNVTGTIRSPDALVYFPTHITRLMKTGVDLENVDHLFGLYSELKPDVVINCVGMVKQHKDSKNSKDIIYLNAMLPHILSELSSAFNSRLVHISTDCVFLGTKGFYSESDTPDATDLYGRSKLLGEVNNDRDITLRTSLIGHELIGSKSLLSWFLSQKGEIRGYRKAIFSGMPAIELARVINEYILPNYDLCGLYHLSTNAISKFDLLSLVADIYEHKIKIIPDDGVVVDRSMNSALFSSATGYVQRPWSDLVKEMHKYS